MDIYEKILDLKQNNKNYVLVTVVKSIGSTPGKCGFKMIVDNEGKTFGTVGGGAIENEALSEAKRLITSDSKNILKEYALNKDEKLVDNDITIVPMSCCGKVTLFYEVEKNASTLYIFGGGHIGSALIDIAVNLKYNIVLVDNRKEICEKYFALNINRVNSDYKEYAETFNPEPDSYFVIVTYGHAFDYDILYALYKRDLVKKYAGVIASKNKAKEMIKNLKADLGENLDLSMLHTPIGLKIGGDTAAEIALSIAAEIQAVKYENNVK